MIVDNKDITKDLLRARYSSGTSEFSNLRYDYDTKRYYVVDPTKKEASLSVMVSYDTERIVNNPIYVFKFN